MIPKLAFVVSSHFVVLSCALSSSPAIVSAATDHDHTPGTNNVVNVRPSSFLNNDHQLERQLNKKKKKKEAAEAAESAKAADAEKAEKAEKAAKVAEAEKAAEAAAIAAHNLKKNHLHVKGFINKHPPPASTPAVAKNAAPPKRVKKTQDKDKVVKDVTKRNNKSHQEKADRSKKTVRGEHDENERYSKTAKKAKSTAHSPTTAQTHEPTMHHVTKAPSSSDTTPSPTMLHGKSSSKAGKGVKTKSAKTKSAKTRRSSKGGKGMRRSKPTMSPTVTMSPTEAPTMDGTIAPTDQFFPDDAVWYDSFEKATFPNDPVWSVSTRESDPLDDDYYNDDFLYDDDYYGHDDIHDYDDAFGDVCTYDEGTYWPVCPGIDEFCDGTYDCEFTSFCDCEVGKIFCDNGINPCMVPGADDGWMKEEAVGNDTRARRLQEEEEEEELPVWELTDEEAVSGALSIKSPNLSNEGLQTRSANVTLTTAEDWGAGYIEFSILSKINYPADSLHWYVDGELYLQDTYGYNHWDYWSIGIDAGVHTITWEYKYNPHGYDKDSVAEVGEVFLDDIIFVPHATYGPTVSPTTYPPTTSPYPTPGPTTFYSGEICLYNQEFSYYDETNYRTYYANVDRNYRWNSYFWFWDNDYASASVGYMLPYDERNMKLARFEGGDYCYEISDYRSGTVEFVEDCEADELTVTVTEPSPCVHVMVINGMCCEGTPSPSPTPENCSGYVDDSFEDGSFACYSGLLSTGGDGEWEFTTAKANTGVYSVRSPNLDNEERIQGSSNFTLPAPPGMPGGVFYFSILAGVVLPFDIIEYYVDGLPVSSGGDVVEMTDFEQRSFNLPPGFRKVDFVYKYNPLGISKEDFPPELPDHIGAVFLDDFFFEPDESYLPDDSSGIAPQYSTSSFWTS